MSRIFYTLLLLSLLGACGPKQLEPDADFVCDNCEDWNLPQAPFRIYGGTWYVGTAGLSSILIEAGEELILIDGGLSQSAAVIDANIRSLGFDPQNISTLLVSHAHYDHAGGIAAIQRFTGASVYSSIEGAKTLSSGELQPDDPQYLQGSTANFPAIANVVAIEDGDVVTVADVNVKAIYTPGHTPGGISWTWESCVLDTCYQLVYADSLTAVSAQGFLFGENPAAAQLIDSADKISLLDCDILLSPHPFFFGMQDKLENRDDGNPFVNNVACSIYAETALGWLERRLRAERGENQ
jgi:metallo-beta-lactamase class B